MSLITLVITSVKNSILIKYGVYLLPLLIYLAFNYVWKNYYISTKFNFGKQINNEAKHLDRSDANNKKESIERLDTDEDNEHHTSKPHLTEREHVPYVGLKVKLDKSGEIFYNLANDRRSIRKFNKNKTVDISVIEKCILAAGTSPSGAHTEPWSFCVIKDEQMKQNIRDVIETEEYFNYTQRMSRQWTTDLRPLKTNHIKEYLTDAPYLILVFKQIYGIRSDDGEKQQHYYNEISVSIATGILLCALQSVGLNSLVTTPLNCGPAIRTLLNRPNNEKLLVLLPVGYAAEDCRIPDIQRKPIEDILFTY